MNEAKINHEMRRRIIRCISEYDPENGRSPSMREIAAQVGLSSLSTVCGYLHRMTRDGLLTSCPGSPRSVRVNPELLKEGA